MTYDGRLAERSAARRAAADRLSHEPIYSDVRSAAGKDDVIARKSRDVVGSGCRRGGMTPDECSTTS